MKVSELYSICLELIENDKAHYDVCLYKKVIGYYEELELHHILEENEENLGTLALSGE
jgi:hypothetical protein